MKIKGNYKIKFIIFQFITYMSYGLCMANLIPYLDHVGLSLFQRSLVLTSYALANIIFQICLGYVSDYFQSIKPIVSWMLIVYAFSAMLTYMHIIDGFMLILTTVSIAVGLLNTLCGFQDTWILLINENISNSLPSIKAFGSIGWALGSFLSATIFMISGYEGIGIFIFMAIGLCLYVMLEIPDIEKIASTEKITIRIVASLSKNRKYLWTVIALFIMYSLVIVNTTLVVDKMIFLNASNKWISLKWTFGSLVEIPMFLVCNRLVKRFGNIKLLMISSIIITFQILLFSIAQTGIHIVVITLLQAFTTPIMMIASKRIISNLTSKNLASSAQMIAMSIFIGGASLMIPLLNSLLSNLFTINIALILYAALGLVAVVIIYGLFRNDVN